MKAHIKSRILSKLADKATAWTKHANSDPVNTPAAWWYDLAATRRQTMNTTMACSITGNTVVINLNYTVQG